MRAKRIKIEGVQMEVPQFGEYSESDYIQYDRNKYWLFDCSMVSTCEPLFDDCESNYEVEKKLQEAKVILRQNNTDSESCALVVRFGSVSAANKFIGRLNSYLIEKARRLEASRAF